MGVKEALRRAGASENEVEDFAEILGGNIYPAHHITPTDAKSQLEMWREEKRMIAANIRAERKRRYEAGYCSVPVGDPVYLNGATRW